MKCKMSLVAAILLLGAACSGEPNDPTAPGNHGNDIPEIAQIPALVELLPGSRAFSPDGTWWGYNMSKVVRRGNLVFTYVVENDDDPSTYSTFRVYMKEGDGNWIAGAGFRTTRPGNLLMDSKGALHAFVFEATDIVLNDSRGKLMHYTLPGASTGDIVSFGEEIVIDHTSGDETVNIRVGAAIGTDNRLVIAFGLGTDEFGNTEQVYTKALGGSGWSQEVAGTELGHDFYYPFVALNSAGTIYVLPVQDDFQGVGNQNVYQIIRFFDNGGGTWESEAVVDHTSHSLAATRKRLLEQSDLYIDAADGVHVFYKEFLGSDGTTSSIKHLTGTRGAWTTRTIDTSRLDLNWVKMIEVQGARYLIGASHTALYVMNETGTTFQEIGLPSDMSGIYPYVATRQGGTADSEAYVDVLLLSGAGSSYPNAANYYVRIDKADIAF